MLVLVALQAGLAHAHSMNVDLDLAIGRASSSLSVSAIDATPNSPTTIQFQQDLGGTKYAVQLVVLPLPDQRVQLDATIRKADTGDLVCAPRITAVLGKPASLTQGPSGSPSADSVSLSIMPTLNAASASDPKP